MCDVYDMAVRSPKVYAEKEMEESSAVDDVISMNLIVLGIRAMSPFVVEIEHMDSLVPMKQVIADEEIAIGGHSAQIIPASIADTPCIGYSSQNRVLEGVGLLGRKEDGKGKKEQEGLDSGLIPKRG